MTRWQQKGETYQFNIFVRSARQQCRPFCMDQESVSAHEFAIK